MCVKQSMVNRIFWLVFLPCLIPPVITTARAAVSLDGELEAIRAEYKLPALAAALILDNELFALGAAGERKSGSGVSVTVDDPFHMGSCTKAMTATLTGVAIERGRLDWDDTLAELFPELRGEMHPSYRGATVRHLMDHRSGLPSNSWAPGTTFMDMHTLPGSPREQRAAYVGLMLKQEPVGAPGETYEYSNAGYGILGAIAERAMDAAWENLMRERLFEPLGMETAGFGAMGGPGPIEAPWQHIFSGGVFHPIEPGRYADNPPVIGPGGTVHCSMADWAKFVRLHLLGEDGEDSIAASETLRRLREPESGGEYAGGWVVTSRPWASGKVYTHAGSNNQNFCVVWMAPDENFAVMAATNAGGGDTAEACDRAAWTLIEKYLVNRVGNSILHPN